MSLNMKTLTQALAKTAAVIEKTVQTTVQEVTGPSRTMSSLIRSVPQGLASPGSCIRLRRPALDENKNAMAMVTEPLFASVANAVGNVENVAKVPKELQGMEMGLLEVKHGLLQIAETLDFLHNNARLIHRALSPENVLITSSGAWKLGGFGFAISADSNTGDMANAQAFHYAEYDVEDSILPLQPSLNYTAPELVKSKAASVGCYSDIFSFGCLAYHLIAHKSLFDCHNNVKMYMNTLTYLSNEAFSSIPPELVHDLQRMLSTNESLRPTAMDFTVLDKRRVLEHYSSKMIDDNNVPLFRDDTRLRALRFLDHMLERDNMQKSEFLKALSDMWKDFDSRVLRYKVLPPLCAELRNLVMQPMILPMVLTIAESQDKNDFELSTLPALVPVLSTAAGETLLLLVKHAELIINKTSLEHLISHVLPMIVRAYDDNDARIQEEVLKKSVFLAKQLDVQLVKQAILPRVHGMALKTTVAAVRVNALLCLGELVHILDKHAVLDVLQTISRCTAVDRSPPTLMCTLGVANSILKQYGVEFAAEHVLPLIVPLLTSQQLNVQQFAKYMLFVKDILRKIEEKRGVTVTDSGIPEVKPSLPVNGMQSHASSKTNTSTTKSNSAWDEDWGPITKQRAASLQNSTNNIPTSTDPVLGKQPIQVTSLQVQSLPIPAVSNNQTAASCPPVDIEWPPRTSSGAAPQYGDAEKQLNTGASSTSSFDDIDPFADWPPRSSGSAVSGVGISNNGTLGVPATKYGSSSNPNTSNNMNFQSHNNSSWTFDTQSSIEQMRPNQSNSLNTGSLGSGSVIPQSSIGFLKQNQGMAASSTYTDKKPTDLGSIFATSKNEQTAPRLAPPPSTAVGRGRGRGRGTSRSSQVKPPSSEQPPLLDLL
ncbi:hypothetical protein FNV43_RR19256 [Rhamnella rubrinervis]|uniref:Protein kinase domain-containing protein n=1 Tax=Rhamnella rubrinervis TaxID=2594499 RepID=A0A8K0E7W0_9ROSA|nr:hypothetical protein FNV43_RR19256 [Rhamnella rubrinervis]